MRQMRETFCGEVSPKWSTFGETDICFKRLFTATGIQMKRYVPDELHESPKAVVLKLAT